MGNTLGASEVWKGREQKGTRKHNKKDILIYYRRFETKMRRFSTFIYGVCYWLLVAIFGFILVSFFGFEYFNNFVISGF